MSDYYDETYEVYDETEVRARKEHECDACKEAIPPRVRYFRICAIYDGSVTVYKRCSRCQAIHLHLRKLCRAGRDQRWPDERLACGLTYEDEWGELPDEIANLAFALPSDPIAVGAFK